MAITAKDIAAPDLCKVKRALISVFDKTGLDTVARKLHSYGVELLSTGGTANFLKDKGFGIRDVSDVTHFPEILDGRVKTLHPHIHGGLLAVGNDPEHQEALERHGIGKIDLLIVNLYPFAQAARSHKEAPATIIEHIDIGGPALIRAGAKNHAYVAVITDPRDYEELLAELEHHEGCLSLNFRKKLAARAFARTAAYDACIARWFQQTHATQKEAACSFPLEEDFVLTGHLKEKMRYGENPHQYAGFYCTEEKRFGVATATLLQGKKLSYNNINDTDAAFELVSEFDPHKTHAVAIIKHANPCGVATGSSLKEAYGKALACDNLSAFGGIVAVNKPLDKECAEEIIKIFTEVIIAPSVTEEAKALLATKKNLRLLITGGLADPRLPSLTVKTVAGGLLVQNRDNANIDDLELQVVTKRAPSAQEMADLKFAYRVIKHVKSNAIVYAKAGATVGIGAGQMSRIDSAQIAASKALGAAQRAGLEHALTQNSVAASDAFFPFPDALHAIIDAGATAIIQPGGSIRDKDVIAAADERNIAMVFTGVRHFRH